jgi:hypothetical protein
MNKVCAKCESRHVGVQYDRVVDMLKYRCENCGYNWSAYPADRRVQSQKEMQDKLGELTS